MEVTDTRFFNGDKCLSGPRRVANLREVNVVLVVYPLSHSLTLPTAIKLQAGPLQMPKPTWLQKSMVKKKLCDAF